MSIGKSTRNPESKCHPDITFSEFTGRDSFDIVGGTNTGFIKNRQFTVKVDNISDENQENLINKLKSRNKNVLVVTDKDCMFLHTRFPKEKQSTESAVLANSLELNQKTREDLKIARPKRLGSEAKNKLVEFITHLLKNGYGHRVIMCGKKVNNGMNLMEQLMSERSLLKDSHPSSKIHYLACNYDLQTVMSNGMLWVGEYNVFLDYQSRLDKQKANNEPIDMYHAKRKCRTKSIYNQLMVMSPEGDHRLNQAFVTECAKLDISDGDIAAFMKIKTANNVSKNQSKKSLKRKLNEDDEREGYDVSDTRVNKKK